MASIPSVHRTRINGSLLGQYHSQPVSILGTIVKADGGPSIQLRSSDGILINIRLKGIILNEPLEGYIEIHGIGQGKNLILADNYIHFPENSIGKGFDMSLWNESIGLLHAIDNGNPWKA